MSACADNARSSDAFDVAAIEQSTGDVFGEPGVLSFTLEGAFSEAFEAAAAGLPDGPLPGLPRRAFDERPAKLTYVDAAGVTKSLDATFKVRGNSSVRECSFAKLSVKLTDKAAARASIFGKNTKFKLGTHCGEEGEIGSIGRLKGDAAPWREALAYRAVGAVLPVSLATRPARVTYVDTASGESSTHGAFVLEHVDKLAARSGAPDEWCREVGGARECAPVLTDEELAAFDPRGAVDPDRVATIAVLNALLGNWDWRLDASDEFDPNAGSRLWNVDVVMVASGAGVEPVPVAQDFDLATIVAGDGRNSGQPHGVPPGDELRQFVTDELVDRTAGLSDASVEAAKAGVRAKKAELYALLDEAAGAPLDELGRAIARAHFDAFFAVLGE